MSNLELVAALLGAVSVWFTVRRIIWAFPIGIVMVVLYAWVFWEAKLYSDMLLQVIFAVMQVQGWIEWQRGDKASDHLIAVRSLSNTQWIWTGVWQALGTLTLGFGMDRYTDAALPYLDAFAAVQSILAQWWMNKRYLENWILWIAVDEVYLIIYSSRELYYTTVLYAIFLLMAVSGYLAWRRQLVV